MGLTLTRLWSVWVARARRRRLRSRSSSERSVARSHSDDSSSGRGSIAEESTFIDASDSLWLQQTREMPILGGGSPVTSLPQDLLLRYYTMQQ
jgi:hypothetical protein